MRESIQELGAGIVYSYESGDIRYTYTFRDRAGFDRWSRTGAHTWTDRRHDRITGQDSSTNRD